MPTSDGGLLQVSRSNRPVQFPIALDVITEQAVSFNDVIYHGSKVSQLLYLHLGNGSLYFGAGNPAFVSKDTHKNLMNHQNDQCTHVLRLQRLIRTAECVDLNGNVAWNTTHTSFRPVNSLGAELTFWEIVKSAGLDSDGEREKSDQVPRWYSSDPTVHLHAAPGGLLSLVDKDSQRPVWSVHIGAEVMDAFGIDIHGSSVPPAPLGIQRDMRPVNQHPPRSLLPAETNSIIAVDMGAPGRTLGSTGVDHPDDESAVGSDDMPPVGYLDEYGQYTPEEPAMTKVFYMAHDRSTEAIVAFPYTPLYDSPPLVQPSHRIRRLQPGSSYPAASSLLDYRAIDPNHPLAYTSGTPLLIAPPMTDKIASSPDHSVPDRQSIVSSRPTCPAATPWRTDAPECPASDGPKTLVIDATIDSTTAVPGIRQDTCDSPPLPYGAGLYMVHMQPVDPTLPAVIAGPAGTPDHGHKGAIQLKTVSMPPDSQPWTVTIRLGVAAFGLLVAVGVAVVRTRSAPQSTPAPTVASESVSVPSDWNVQSVSIGASDTAFTTPISSSRPDGQSPVSRQKDRGGADIPMVVMERDGITVNGVEYRRVGRILLSDNLLGRGAGGTKVYEGLYDGREAAIKQIPKDARERALLETKLLSSLSNMQSVVGFFGMEHTRDFYFLALHRCDKSLADSIRQAYDERSKRAEKADHRLEEVWGPWRKHVMRSARKAEPGPGRVERDSRYFVAIPSTGTRLFMRRLVQAVYDLHRRRVVHRDIKPQNILLVRTHGHTVDSQSMSVVQPTLMSPEQLALDTAIRRWLGPAAEPHDLWNDWQIKIADLGLAKHFRHQERGGQSSLSFVRAASDHSNSTTGTGLEVVGTHGWLAPELLQQQYEAQDRGVDLDDSDEYSLDTEDAAGISKQTSAALSAPSTPVAGEAREMVGSDVIAHQDSEARRQRRKRLAATDVWSLGCVLYTILDPGYHPFGRQYERDLNALQGEPDLSRLYHLPEAQDLLSMMLQRDPSKRPELKEVLDHPLFWSDYKRLDLLTTLTGRLEAQTVAPALRKINNVYACVVGRSWLQRLPKKLQQDLQAARRYDESLFSDLVRAIRNKASHWAELPDETRREIVDGSTSQALIAFMSVPARFPSLTMSLYRIACKYFADRDEVGTLLGPAATAKYSARAQHRMAEIRKLAAEADLERLTATATHDMAVAAGTHANTAGSNGLPTVHGERGWYCSQSLWCIQPSQPGALASGVCDDDVDPTGEARESAEPLGRGHVVAGSIRCGMSKFRGGGNFTKARYKLKVCSDWQSSGGRTCGRGARCDYAHGAVEVRLFGAKPDTLAERFLLSVPARLVIRPETGSGT